MMRSRLARLLVFFAVLWLPLQTVAALVMPSCRHAAEQMIQPVHSQHDMTHCQRAEDQAGDGRAESDNGQPADAEHACHACGFCHLAGAAALPTAPAGPAYLPSAQRHALPAERPHVSHVPDQPRRPPRTLA